ncbi:unnamed protein product [Clonostachys rosea f. rosea IK726]|uniref:Major facilitator superfamily (MFS) profile domain-containing protein n=2 Tax=Bionectria ochroleuca TaxID=29856 RepID=A0A0B7KCU8_BIOOC|nr:unnamed protein product [Clonostachys rosea f. rosea IK726]
MAPSLSRRLHLFPHPRNDSTVLSRPSRTLRSLERSIDGLSPWYQVIVGFFVNFMTWGMPNAYGVFQLYYSQTTSWSSSQISWVGSIQLFLAFIGGSVSGRLADAGYARHCILLGSALNIIGIMTASCASAYWQVILSLGVCVGLGGGMMALPAAAAIGSRLRHRRALAMSLSGCGASIGAISYAAIVQYLIPVIGFPWAVRCCGLLSIIASITANALARPPLYTRKSGGLIDWSAFESGFFGMFCLGGFLVYFSLFAATIYINSFASNTLGFEASKSIQFLLISNAASILARPMSGMIADHVFGEVNTWNLVCFLLSGMLFAWIGVRSQPAMYAYSVLMGFLNGAAQGIFPSAVNSLSIGTDKLGTRLGMVFGLCGVASLAGPPTMGAIIDANKGQYLWAQVCGGTLMCVGCLTVGSARLFFARTRLRDEIGL